jgi:hypothetical protein
MGCAHYTDLVLSTLSGKLVWDTLNVGGYIGNAYYL